MEKKNVNASGKEISLVELGTAALVVGACSSVFSLGSIGVLMYGLGASCYAYNILSNKGSTYKKLWTNTGLINKDGAMPLLINKRKREFGYDLVFTLPTGLSTEDFEKNKKAIEQHLDKRIEINYANKKLIISVYEKELQSEYPYEVIETKNITDLVIGYGFSGKPEIVDLSECPHMLIAGESGSGKSTALRSIITTLILTKNIKDLELHLVDMKRGAEFNLFKKCEIVKSFSRTKEEALEELMLISDEVDRRYNLFYENDCVDIKEYNQRFRNRKLKYKIVIIDEFADLQEEKESQMIIEELSAKARACGIHIIISTQRPDAKILNGRIKANIPTVLGLKTMNSTNSRIIIDESGLEDLRGKGHGILIHKGKTEIQAMNLSPQQARNLLQPLYKKESGIIKMQKKEKAQEKTGEIKDFGFLKSLVGGKE